MKKILILLLLSPLTVLQAQQSNPPIVIVTTAPSGSCSSGLPDRQVLSTGTLYSCQSGTWTIVGGAGGTTSKALGSDMWTSSGAFLDSFGYRSFQYGYHAFGDSITCGVGAQSTTTQGYAYLVAAEMNNGPAFVNYCIIGGKAPDVSVRVFANENPGDVDNPIYTYMAGTNEANSGVPNQASQTAYAQYFLGAVSQLAISSTNKAPAQSNGAVTSMMYVTGSQGTGYVTGDTITYTCGTTNAVGTVTAVSGIVQYPISITTPGVGCVPSASTSTSTSGSGTGLLVSVQATPNMVQAGTWSTDSTYTANPALVTTTNGSTVTYTNCYVGPIGDVFVYAYSTSSSNSSTWSFSIDRTTQTDSITGLTSIPVHNGSDQPVHLGPGAPLAGLFTGISQGSHTCVFTANVVSSGQVGFIGFSFPPSNRYHGTTSPAVFVGGIPPQGLNTNATAVATVIGNIETDVAIMLNAGLNVKYIDTSSALDYNVDFYADGSCPASTTPGLHPNNCGHRHLANVFEDAIRGGGKQTSYSYTLTAPAFYPQSISAGPYLNYFDDFLTTDGVTSQSIGSPSGGNGCALNNGYQDVNHPGNIYAISGTAGSGTGTVCTLLGTKQPITTPAGTLGWTFESVVDVPVLPGTTAAAYQVGLANALTANPWTTGEGFYLSSANGVANDWYCEYGSTPTLIDSGVAATAGAWTRLTYVSDGSLAHWYINGTQVCGSGVALSNLPATSQLPGWAATALSTTSVFIIADYLSLQRNVVR